MANIAEDQDDKSVYFPLISEIIKSLIILILVQNESELSSKSRRGCKATLRSIVGCVRAIDASHAKKPNHDDCHTFPLWENVFNFAPKGSMHHDVGGALGFVVAHR